MIHPNHKRCHWDLVATGLAWLPCTTKGGRLGNARKCIGPLPHIHIRKWEAGGWGLSEAELGMGGVVRIAVGVS